MTSAVEHRMTGLLWSAVVEGRVDLPTDTVRVLAQTDLSATAHHVRLWSTTEAATQRLADAGVGAVSFKGVTDEQRWFGRMGERPCADVDIVIKDSSRLEDAIRALDPTHALLGVAAIAARRGQLRSVDVEFGGAWIDLHVDPLKVGSGWRHPELWFARTEQLTSPSGVDLEVFQPAAVAALKLLHIGRDNFRYLLNVEEVRRILESEVDWSDVETLAESEGLGAPIRIAAEAAAEEVGSTPPEISVAGWRELMWRRLWAPQNRLLGELGRERFVRRSQWLLPITIPGRTLEHLSWLARTAFPPPELLELKHPDARGPYLLRLITSRLGYWYRRRRRVSRMSS
jgi:hypothetical protein